MKSLEELCHEPINRNTVSLETWLGELSCVLGALHGVARHEWERWYDIGFSPVEAVAAHDVLRGLGARESCGHTSSPEPA